MRKCWSPPPESLPKSHSYFIRASSPSKTGKTPVSPLIDRCQHHQQDCKRIFLRTWHFAPTNEQPSANCITQKTRQMRDDSWGAFKRNTEAGRLLSRLYGVEGDVSSQIKYPKLKTKPKTRHNTQDHRWHLCHETCADATLLQQECATGIFSWSHIIETLQSRPRYAHEGGRTSNGAQKGRSSTQNKVGKLRFAF